MEKTHEMPYEFDTEIRKGFFVHCTKMKLSINVFFSKCGQTRSFLRIWSHLLKKSVMENFIFCAVSPRTLNLFMFEATSDFSVLCS